MNGFYQFLIISIPKEHKHTLLLDIAFSEEIHALH